METLHFTSAKDYDNFLFLFIDKKMCPSIPLFVFQSEATINEVQSKKRRHVCENWSIPFHVGYDALPAMKTTVLLLTSLLSQIVSSNT